MTLRLYNTLSRTTEEFVPLKKGIATLYSCGPTVYDHVHIGNLRPYVFSDTVKRALLEAGYAVEHTINLTDFGHLQSDGDDGADKMLQALKRDGLPFSIEAMIEVGKKYTESFQKDTELLNILPPTIYAPASSYVREEIVLVQTLSEKGYTYETSDGFYFDISRFPQYGKLGNINIEELKVGARVSVNEEKRHPADFAVWKKSPLGWKAPWGTGFPGWHIECTAMIFATLGKQIDIHTGGIDHIATHHNGEIAQAEAATGKAPYVRYWMHNAHIHIDSTKISKSLGNGIRLSQLLERGYPALAYRYWLLSGHYRSPMNFTFEALDGAKAALFRLKRYLVEDWGTKGGELHLPTWHAFRGAIDDDLDTPKALAVLWNMVNDPKISPQEKVATIQNMDAFLGLGLSETESEMERSLGILKEDAIPEDIQELLKDRKKARKEKEWALSDRIREAINMRGYLVEDTPDGQRVKKA